MKLTRRTSGIALVALAASSASANTIVNVNTTTGLGPIYPQIYGVANATRAQLIDLNFAISRNGGNEASSYNWQANGAAKGNDYYYESWGDDSPVQSERTDTAVADAKAAGAQAMLTVPLLPYIAKLGPNRSTLWSYSVSKYGAQQDADPYNSDAGNGVSAATGSQIANDISDANQGNSLALQGAWLDHTIAKWGHSNVSGVKYYLMDNEPSIWWQTHIDVAPTGLTYNNLLYYYEAYGAMVRAKDPNAIICGPEEFGWSGYQYCGYDHWYANTHGWGFLPEYAAHNNVEYTPYLLYTLAQYEKAHGVRLMDMLTFHYYPQQGEYSDDNSANMQAIRNRSVRSLWDPNYVDTSWIGTQVDLIPLMKRWIKGYYPGLLTGITEYNWGDDAHMNGATTQADILGIFGVQQLNLASRWGVPATNSPTYLAMKMYRNYDGNKSCFGDVGTTCTVANPDTLSAYASKRSSDGATTIMVINKVTTSTTLQLNLTGVTGSTAQVYQISSDSQTSISQLPSVAVGATGLTTSIPQQSVTLFVIPKK